MTEQRETTIVDELRYAAETGHDGTGYLMEKAANVIERLQQNLRFSRSRQTVPIWRWHFERMRGRGNNFEFLPGLIGKFVVLMHTYPADEQLTGGDHGKD